MIITFNRNDDFTLMLRNKGYRVSDYFISGTTIPLGYTFCMEHLRFVYHVKDHVFFLISFEPVKARENTVGTLRELYTLVCMAKSIPSLLMGKVMINPYPVDEQQKKRQEVLLKFAAKLGAGFIFGHPVDYAVMDFTA